MKRGACFLWVGLALAAALEPAMGRDGTASTPVLPESVLKAAGVSLVKLEDSVQSVRLDALTRLGMVGGQGVLDYLVYTLRDHDPAVRRKALALLSDKADASVGPKLLALRDDRRAEVRRLLLDAVLSLALKQIVPDIEVLLGDPDPAVRTMAAQVVARLCPADLAYAKLIRLACDPQDCVRLSVLELLFGDNRQLGDCKGSGWTDEQRERALRYLRSGPLDAAGIFKAVSLRSDIPLDDDPGLNLLRGLTGLVDSPPDSGPFVDALIGFLKDSNPATRIKAAWCFKQMKLSGRLDHIPALLPLLADSHPGVRLTAVRAVWELARNGPHMRLGSKTPFDARIATAYRELLRDPAPLVRIFVLRGFGSFVSEEAAVDAFLPALDDRDPGVRGVAVEQLACQARSSRVKERALARLARLADDRGRVSCELSLPIPDRYWIQGADGGRSVDDPEVLSLSSPRDVGSAALYALRFLSGQDVKAAPHRQDR